MAQNPIEIILLQQWASMMTVPIWITDAAGELLYFNEPTEDLIGVRFDEAGEMPASILSERFSLCNVDGTPVADHDRPLMIALHKLQPAQRELQMMDDAGQKKIVSDTAIPIIGEGDRPLGALVILWESGDSHS
ncbi:MAG TPA: PAS domain-containing protein [Acidimicrobiia bacterium]|jgi:PAS domain-containing protein|nr:PAS domain-containing protein [Acidimicrobiia bacterium]